MGGHDSQVTFMQVLADGEGSPDFVYTIGLNELGHPEFLMTGWPTSGTENDPDWHLSKSDIGACLAELCRTVRSGEEIRVGSTWEDGADRGRTRLFFTAKYIDDDEEVVLPLLSPATVEVAARLLGCARRIMRYLLWRAETNGSLHVRESQRQIAERKDTHQPTVVKALARLEVHGWVAQAESGRW